ncbi:MAG: NrdH-redoxin [Candidatus Taylorbacteria bacterium RIFCSPLOWO2_01_FULL_45_15b]|uniref:NrdH-redoxin n=1 Tax=Candidatus Taylorbacteria bacterium RIFCSPLOWO2_01_FULL_45_15b TaxID=1802319 RepID=A0A1G2N6Y9_9BACT|nr:MAG: NrdH-redoxin [Candidatus Taylorbacteria bacterium RIFCSPLOWO2_01_FULL_45_15b]
MKTVTIFTTPTCTYCHQAKEFFKANGVQYIEHNVASDLNARKEMVEKSGQLGVPVIFVDDQVIIGYDKATLSSLLLKK